MMKVLEQQKITQLLFTKRIEHPFDLNKILIVNSHKLQWNLHSNLCNLSHFVSICMPIVCFMTTLTFQIIPILEMIVDICPF